MNTETKMWLAVVVLILAFEKAGSAIIPDCVKGPRKGYENCLRTLCCPGIYININNDICDCNSPSGGGITHDISITRPTNTAQQPTNLFLVPWFLGLFLWSLGALIQKIALDRPHQL